MFFQSVFTVYGENHVTNHAAFPQDYGPGADNNRRTEEDVVITQKIIFVKLLSFDRKNAQDPLGF